MTYSQTARVTEFGSQKNARRVTHLTAEERAAVRAGAVLFVGGCPAVNGVTDRRIVHVNGRFYTRMP